MCEILCEDILKSFVCHALTIHFPIHMYVGGLPITVDDTSGLRVAFSDDNESDCMQQRAQVCIYVCIMCWTVHCG